MIKEISIINYPYGNVLSLMRAFEYLDVKVKLIEKASEIKFSNKLVFPGVGTFDKAIKFLKKNNFFDEILNHFDRDKPFLGICLGMHVLMEKSEELGDNHGLGFIEGKVKKIPEINKFNQRIKLPHINWSIINENYGSERFFNLENKYMYFVHSFAAQPINNKEVLAFTEYENTNICCVIKKNNIIGCQFHPEKSGNDGLSFLQEFLNY